MALIRADGLGKSYGSTRAVNDLSFEVHPGSVTGFLGPNGSGKSTTMRLMLGLDRGEGATTYDGKTFGELDHPMRHVGALLEAKPFHPTRHARNHLRMLAAPNRIPDARVDQVLEMVGLTTVAGGKPGKFSLGMGQRLGIAGALLGDPDTLILDEPSNGLDPQGITWLRNLLKHLAGEGRVGVRLEPPPPGDGGAGRRARRDRPRPDDRERSRGRLRHRQRARHGRGPYARRRCCSRRP